MVSRRSRTTASVRARTFSASPSWGRGCCGAPALTWLTCPRWRCAAASAAAPRLTTPRSRAASSHASSITCARRARPSCAPTTPAASCTCAPTPRPPTCRSRSNTLPRCWPSSLELGDEVVEVQLVEGLGQGHACHFVPAHRAVVVPLHDWPRLGGAAVGGAAVLRIADVARAWLLQLTGQPVADVDRAHQVDDLSSFAQRIQG